MATASNVVEGAMHPAISECTPDSLVARHGVDLQELVSQSLPVWERSGATPELAADWYQISQKLCRWGVPMDEVIHRIEQLRPVSTIGSERGEHTWSNFREFIRYYIVRGYQDAVR
jgi:hypothetical protein